MVVCVNCGLKVPTLYHVYNKTNFCLSTCVHCGKISDKYVEYELPLMIIDFFLFKVEVYRHLIHNYRSRPFFNKYRIGSRVSNNLVKVILLLFSASILDSYSLLTTSNYLTHQSDFCYPQFEFYNKNSLNKIATYFTNPSDISKHKFYKFKSRGLDRLLDMESKETVTEFVDNIAKAMLYKSRLNVFKRRGLNDEYCNRSYNRLSQFLLIVFLQNPTLCNFKNKTLRSLDELNELAIMFLSFLRVLSYCLYISLFNFYIRRFRKSKNTDLTKSHKDCKCNYKELHDFQISYMDIVFSLLLCFHIKALALMMNIWYPKHTILVVIEFYIHLSHVLELNSICNIPLMLSWIIVVTASMMKLGVYFPWLYLMNHFKIF